MLKENKKIENIINVYGAFKRTENSLKDSATSNVLINPLVSIGNAAQKIIFHFSKIPVDKIEFGLIKVANQSQHSIKQDERALLLHKKQP